MASPDEITITLFLHMVWCASLLVIHKTQAVEKKWKKTFIYFQRQQVTGDNTATGFQLKSSVTGQIKQSNLFSASIRYWSDQME